MNKDKDYCTPADIFTEHGMRKVKKDYESVDLKLAIVNLMQAVDEQEIEGEENSEISTKY